MNIATNPGAHYSHLTDKNPKTIQRLPGPVRDKLSYLRDQAMKVSAMASGLYATYQKTRENRDEAAADLTRFDREYPPQDAIVDGKRTKVHLAERAPLVERIERLNGELKKLSAAQDSNTLGFSVDELLDKLAQMNGKFVPVIPVQVKIENRSLTATLSSIRARQAQLRDQISEIENLPSSAAEAKAAAKAQIDAIAEKGAPDAIGLLHGGQIAFQEEMVIGSGHGNHQYSTVAQVKNAFALTVWLHRDLLLQKINEQIDAEADDKPAMTVDERTAKLDQLNKSLTRLLRDEEAIIMKIEEHGSVVPRLHRDPLILLGVELAK